MCGYHELAAKKSYRIFQKLKQLLLLFRRQAVFRLVKQIKPVFLDLIRKIKECTLTIGMLPDIIHDILPDILRLCIAPCLDHLF